jgi:hypothetical protein
MEISRSALRDLPFTYAAKGLPRPLVVRRDQLLEPPRLLIQALLLDLDDAGIPCSNRFLPTCLVHAFVFGNYIIHFLCKCIAGRLAGQCNFEHIKFSAHTCSVKT